MAYKITVDIGGTFTDVVVSDGRDTLVIGKAPTTPNRAFDGVHEALIDASSQINVSVKDIIKNCSIFIYSTTRSTNAIVEQKTARTAFLTTQGFPDTLVMREGGKLSPFDLDIPYPDPYVPRRLTLEIPERVNAEGKIVLPLDEAVARALVRGLAGRIEAVAICLLWSIANPAHEQALGRIVAEELPGVPFTLSHQLNPIMREFRRASGTVIDASLKPLMSAHLRAVAEDLAAAGFAGELLMATGFGGLMHIEDVAERPIYTVKSGPALAPVSARHYAAELGISDVIVGDMGGTSFDVSLIRGGNIAISRETWLGDAYLAPLIATPSVDVRSIGAGGGSIGWVDEGGLLRVGPQSAGSVPGPACYGHGGVHATVTDAAAVLGYLSPDHFLGGRMPLNVAAAERAVAALAVRLGVSTAQAADGVLQVASENMVSAIRDITIAEGVDPRESLFVAGGGAAGLVIARIIASLDCRRVLVPRTAGALSAVGGQYSDIVAEFTANCPTDTASFAYERVNAMLADLDRQADRFTTLLEARGVTETSRSYLVEARYAFQVWELELRLPNARFRGEEDVRLLSQLFDAEHKRVFAVADVGQIVETLTWRLRLSAPVRFGKGPDGPAVDAEATPGIDPVVARQGAYFAGFGVLETAIYQAAATRPGSQISGPAIIVNPTSTLVVPPGATASVTGSGNYLLELN